MSNKATMLRRKQDRQRKRQRQHRESPRTTPKDSSSRRSKKPMVPRLIFCATISLFLRHAVVDLAIPAQQQSQQLRHVAAAMPVAQQRTNHVASVKDHDPNTNRRLGLDEHGRGNHRPASKAAHSSQHHDPISSTHARRQNVDGDTFVAEYDRVAHTWQPEWVQRRQVIQYDLPNQPVTTQLDQAFFMQVNREGEDISKSDTMEADNASDLVQSIPSISMARASHVGLPDRESELRRSHVSEMALHVQTRAQRPDDHQASNNVSLKRQVQEFGDRSTTNTIEMLGFIRITKSGSTSMLRWLSQFNIATVRTDMLDARDLEGKHQKFTHENQDVLRCVLVQSNTYNTGSNVKSDRKLTPQLRGSERGGKRSSTAGRTDEGDDDSDEEDELFEELDDCAHRSYATIVGTWSVALPYMQLSRPSQSNSVSHTQNLHSTHDRHRHHESVHNTHPTHQAMQPQTQVTLQTFTILRDPFDRLVSYFHYYRRIYPKWKIAATEAQNKMLLAGDLEGWMRLLYEEGGGEVFDLPYQMAYIADDTYRAISLLKGSSPRILGLLTECHEASLLLLQERHPTIFSDINLRDGDVASINDEHDAHDVHTNQRKGRGEDIIQNVDMNALRRKAIAWFMDDFMVYDAAVRQFEHHLWNSNIDRKEIQTCQARLNERKAMYRSLSQES